MIRYVLLSSGQGVAVERNGGIVYDTLPVKFDNIPEGNILVSFESKRGVKYTTPNEDGVCFVPATILDGDVLVTLHIMEGVVHPSKWACEALVASRTKDNGAVVQTSDARISQYIAEIKAENDALRRTNAEMLARMERLDKRISDLIDGYDIT